MTEFILYREFEPPVSKEDILQISVEGVKCMDMHRVDWNVSLLNTNGGCMLCHFSGHDAESVRNALRQMQADITTLGPCTIHDRSGLGTKELEQANVIVERHFDDPVEFADIEAQENRGAWCLEKYDVKFMRTYFSLDRKYMACLYQAPDAESVRQAQRMAQMPVTRVWSFLPVSPADLQV